jgi:hypothetical protein
MSFAATQYIGFAAGGSAATISLVDSGSSGTNATSYTFPSKTLGVGRIVVGVFVRGGNAALPITSLTVGGNAATSRISKITTAGGGDRLCAIFEYDGNTAATGDVVVNLTGTVDNCAVGIWLVTGGGALYDTGFALDADPLSTTSCAYPAGGVMVGVAAMNLTGVTYTWSGLTENIDTTIETYAYTMASAAFAAAAASPTISVDNDSGGPASAGALVLASWEAG